MAYRRTQAVVKRLAARRSAILAAARATAAEAGMAAVQIAMPGDLPYTALRDGVFAHPTLAESLNNLCNSFVD